MSIFATALYIWLRRITSLIWVAGFAILLSLYLIPSNTAYAQAMITVTNGGLTISNGDTTPSTLDGTDFGSRTSNIQVAATFRIENTSSAALTITDSVLSGNTNNFRIGSVTAGVTIQPGGTLPLQVSFDPLIAGRSSPTLTITSNAATDSTYSFVLTGEALIPEIQVTQSGQNITHNSGLNVGNPQPYQDFGAVSNNSVIVEKIYTITNMGTTPLTLGGNAVSTFSGGTTPFTVTVQPDAAIQPGQSSNFVIRYTSVQGTQSDTIQINSNDANENPFNFDVIGSGANNLPEIDVSLNATNIPDDLANDPASSNATSFRVGVGGGVTRTYTISNTGVGTLNLGANPVSITGTDAAQFSVPQQPAATVLPGQSTTFQIQFSPNSPRIYGPADVAINNDDSNENPYNFRIQGIGEGVEIDVTGNGNAIADNAAHSPSAGDHTDFGNVNVAGGTVVRTFTIENNGFGKFLDLQSASAISISGSHASDFTVTRQPTQLVDVGVPETFEITFNPSAAGLRGPVDVTISSDDDDENPYNFRLQGTGTAAPEINVTGNAQSIVDGDTTPQAADHTDFGFTDIAAGTISRTFTIENTGTDILNITNAVLSGADAGDFSITTPPASTVAPASSTTIVVAFDPSAIGNKVATLTINSDDSDEGVYDFAIAGTGTNASGDITIILNVEGPDANVGFNSATAALNFVLASSGGMVQTTIIGVSVGTHLLTADDLGANGYGIAAISCSDTDSTTDPGTRSATIVLSASENVTCTFTLKQTRTITSQMIVDYLSTRNNFILNNQADRTRRLERLNEASARQGGTATINTPLGFAAQLPSPVDFSLNGNVLAYSGSARDVIGFLGARGGNSELPDISKWDIWSEGSFSLFEEHNRKSGTFGVIHAGADYLISADFLLGAKVQVDWMDQTFSDTNGGVDGIGFLAGPYATIALSENLFFDVSGAWGVSQNTVSPFGTYSNVFSTNRWMIDASLIGQFVLDNWTVRPELAFAYIDEYQNAYTDSLNVPIPAQRVAQGELSFAPRISYNVMLENGGTLTPWLEVKGHYAFQTYGTPSTGSYGAGLNGLSASIGSGLDIVLTSGVSLSLSGQYGGIGTNNTSYGASFGMNIPLD